MVSVGVVSDKVYINPVMIVLAGRAAGGSSWCLPAKLLTYVPGLKQTIVIYLWVGGTVVFSLSHIFCLSSSFYKLKRVLWRSGLLTCGFDKKVDFLTDLSLFGTADSHFWDELKVSQNPTSNQSSSCLVFAYEY